MRKYRDLFEPNHRQAFPRQQCPFILAFVQEQVPTMTPSEEFESILKDVVNAKRLSASKVANLTEIAMKNMAHDTQLVTILYRTHKSLPSPSKVSSLYVFDALARAAKHQATKHGITGDAYTQPGNCATFLLKIGGVVEGLFQDMIASGSQESKEKTKKILDIWVKGNTFPATILTQLLAIVEGGEKEPQVKPSPTTDPRIPAQPLHNPAQTHIQNPQIPTLDPQATLLALLTQAAASSTNTSISQSTGTSASPLDAAQMAVLQQLAHTAASVPSVTQSLPSAAAVNLQNFPSSSAISGSSRSPPSNYGGHDSMTKSDQKLSRYRSPENDPGSNPHYDERDSMRGKYRGGFRPRGRGDRFGRRWDDRDRFGDSERDGGLLHTSRGGRSRSRSPPSRSGGDRRISTRDHSPPRRPSIASPPSWRQAESGKDEFGRDIRAQSRSPSLAKEDSPRRLRQSPTPPISHTNLKPPIELQTSLALSNNLDPEPVAPLLNASTSSDDVPVVSNTITSGLGMESFDPTTFDYTSPASWEALGKLWQVTNGYLPTTEQLMQFMITYTTGQTVPQSIEGPGFASNGGFSSSNYPRGRGRGGFRGRGGSMYGNSRNMYEGQVRSMQETDAIVLGGHEDAPTPRNTTTVMGTGLATQEGAPNGSGSGRMQRVGDKWVFVRGGTAMDVS